MRPFTICLLIAGIGLMMSGPLLAQVRRPLDGITAGREAHQQAEARRQAAIGAQIQANQNARYYADLAQWRDHTFYYGVPRLGYYPGAIVEDYYYRRTPFGGVYRRQSVATSPYVWPLAPTYIAPLHEDPIRQPIGQRQEQTGPNRWESYPIYATDATIGPTLPAEPPPPTPRIQVQEFPPAPASPAAKTGDGPREF